MGHSVFYVHEEEDGVAFQQSGFYLLADLAFENVVRTFHIAARVHNVELLAHPFGMAVVTVAGHAGNGVHDGIAALHEAVKEGGLSHIGASDDGY